ncbi:MAG: hypothetical protein QM681_13495 [Novosphingobium sp.]
MTLSIATPLTNIRVYESVFPRSTAAVFKHIIPAVLLLGLPLAMTAADARSPVTRLAAKSDLQLEHVVMLMRHGIRPPTSANPAPAGYTQEAWPSWPVDWL